MGTLPSAYYSPNNAFMSHILHINVFGLQKTTKAVFQYPPQSQPASRRKRHTT